MNTRYFHLLLFALAVCPLLLLNSPSSQAQTYEIKQEIIDANGWFGGDNRPNGRRTVGVGQSVLIDKAMTIRTFAFHFASMFDFAQNPYGTGHEVTLKLNVRDAAGVIVKTTSVTVPASFSSGWITWDKLNLPVTAGIKLIFTSYVVGGFDVNPYYSSHSAGQSNPYTDGVRYGKDGISDSDLENWTDWSPLSWDAAFRLSGTTSTSGADDNDMNIPAAIRLEQNYPNPVSTSTTFEFAIPKSSHVTMEIYNIMGVKVKTLIDDEVNSGTNHVRWVNEDLPNGMYFIRMGTGIHTISRMFTILK